MARNRATQMMESGPDPVSPASPISLSSPAGSPTEAIPGAAPEPQGATAAWRRLQDLDRQIEAVVLTRQHPVTGLLPASTANTVHGNYGDAWVRDCVYSVQCVWGLSLAYRRLKGPCRRSFELEQRVVQLMRGLLSAMLRLSLIHI